jgi:hypothetical protein
MKKKKKITIHNNKKKIVLTEYICTHVCIYIIYISTYKHTHD